MNRIEFIKKYSNWKSIIEIPNDKYLVYYNPTINVREKITNIKHIYTSESLNDYIIVESAQFCYIGGLINNEVICFAKCSTLKEACESL